MIPLSEISRDCIDAWVALYHSLKNKTLVEQRACSVANMDELLTGPTFAAGLVRMRAALEDFFLWVDLLADSTPPPGETPPSNARFYTVVSHRHLQESIVYALQEHQDLMAVKIHRLAEAIDQAEKLRDSQ
ncbi:hypothetical protein LIER_31818 [Lithospermum erythrorhizon]|uniref:Uncharacterized protein n=1 Tax=Lithospermum erythrorhizon TaxID=34254 RepID=A0AAV3RV69_LITER